MSTFNQNKAIAKSQSTVKAFLSSFVCDDFFSDIVNVCLYPSEFSSVSSNQGNSVIDLLKSFVNNLRDTATKANVANLNQISSYTKLVSTILNIRESGSSIITYNNTAQHLPGLDLTQQKLIQKVLSQKVKDNNEFQKTTNKVLGDVQAFYEVLSIKDGINSFENFVDYATSNNVSIYEATKEYKERVIQLYNELSNLQSLNKKESEKDYFIISDKKSTQDLAKSLVQYLSTDYSFYTSGFELIDDNIEGFEAASVHTISAPSNHGKSVFLANIIKRMVDENIHSFEENEALVFLTLEDDIKKLTRRLCAIFGNYDAGSIKKLYSTAYEVCTGDKMISTTNMIKKNLYDIIDNVLVTSIYHATKGKIQLVVKHCNENEFSAGDLSKFIDVLNVEGIKVKAAAVDYLDVMAPTVRAGGHFGGDTYEKQGQITHELRLLSRNKNIPILTATQNNKGSENLQYGMNNTQVGDSYLKVRYSDFWYMVRMNNGLTPFDDAVAKHVLSADNYTSSNQIDPKILKMKDQICDNLIPFECKITKSKDAGRDKSKFALFCSQNLRIYNNLNEYLNDLEELNKKTKYLDGEIVKLSQLSISSVSDDLSNFDDLIEADRSFEDQEIPEFVQ